MQAWFEHEWALTGWRLAGGLLLLAALQLSIGYKPVAHPVASTTGGFSPQALALSFSRPQPVATTTAEDAPRHEQATAKPSQAERRTPQPGTAKPAAKPVTAAAPPSSAQASSQADHGAHPHVEISQPMFAAPPVPPRYPSIARRRGQQGTVWLDVWLDTQGQQTRLVLHQSSGTPALDQAALEAVAGWRFLPHRVNDRAIASWVRIPVEFALQ